MFSIKLLIILGAITVARSADTLCYACGTKTKSSNYFMIGLMKSFYWCGESCEKNIWIQMKDKYGFLRYGLGDDKKTVSNCNLHYELVSEGDHGPKLTEPGWSHFAETGCIIAVFDKDQTVTKNMSFYDSEGLDMKCKVCSFRSNDPEKITMIKGDYYCANPHPDADLKVTLRDGKEGYLHRYHHDYNKIWDFFEGQNSVKCDAINTILIDTISVVKTTRCASTKPRNNKVVRCPKDGKLFATVKEDYTTRSVYLCEEHKKFDDFLRPKA